MENDNSSLAGMVITLHEAGYSPDQIVKEMASKPGCKVSKVMVNRTIEKATGRGADSRMLLAIYEMQVEALGLIREMVTDRRINRARAIARKLERHAAKSTSPKSKLP